MQPLTKLRSLLTTFDELEAKKTKGAWVDVMTTLQTQWDQLGKDLEARARAIWENNKYRIHFAVPTQDGETSVEAKLFADDPLSRLFELWIDENYVDEYSCGFRVKETGEELKQDTPIGTVQGTVEIYPTPGATWHLPRRSVEFPVGPPELKLPPLKAELTWERIADWILDDYLEEHGTTILQAMGWKLAKETCLLHHIDLIFYEGEKEAGLGIDDRLFDHAHRNLRLEVRVQDTDCLVRI